MSIVCDRGLFIGAGRQAKSKNGKLQHADSDAASLRNYFASATGTPYWEKLPKGSRVPTRLEVLSAIIDFANKAPASSVCLLFFSGHGEVRDSKLFLKAFDTQDSLLSDSGIPLSRILSELRGHGADSKRFVVFLDCCRSGGTHALYDDVPANVCLVYGCAPGSAAIEAEGGGVFTRSVLESLERIAHESGSRSCSVQVLCARVARDMFIWRRSGALRIEVLGMSADRLTLPLADCSVDGERRQSEPPGISLRYGFGSKEDYDEAFQRLALGLFSWYGVDTDSPSGRAYIRDHFKESKAQNNSVLMFDIEVPRGSMRWSISDFIAQTLSIPTNSSQSIVLAWSQVVKMDLLVPIKHVVGGTWSKGIAEHQLSWKSMVDRSSLKGVLTVGSDPDRTTIYIQCQTEDCYDRPLLNLVPVVCDVLEILLAI